MNPSVSIMKDVVEDVLQIGLARAGCSRFESPEQTHTTPTLASIVLVMYSSSSLAERGEAAWGILLGIS